MAGLTAAGMQKILDHLAGKATYALPTLYATLVTTTPGVGSAGTEVTAGQYANYTRTQLTGSSWSGAATSGGQSVSTYNAAIDFGNAGLGAQQITFQGIDFYDAPTGGNRLWYLDISSFAFSYVGVDIVIPSGSISVSLYYLGQLVANIGISHTYTTKMIDHMTGKTSLTAPSMYFTLTSTLATDNGTTVTPGTEATYTGYARVQLLTADVGSATVSTNWVSVSTVNTKSYGAATSLQSGLVAWGLMDASSGGNLIVAGTTPNGPFTIISGGVPQFPSGAAVFQLQ